MVVAGRAACANLLLLGALTRRHEHARCSSHVMAAVDVPRVESWLDSLYDGLDYEAILGADGADDDDDHDGGDVDDLAIEYAYGECDLGFFLTILGTALDACGPSALEPPRRAFIDLGGGKGQLALAAAYAASDRVTGRFVSLELLPELHGISRAAVAAAMASDPSLQGRVLAERGDIYDEGALQRCDIADACVVFAYASKFEGGDGVRVEKLSRVLSASPLPHGAVVATLNRELCPEHGWERACPPVDGPTPHESAGTGRAHFWRRRRRATS